MKKRETERELIDGINKSLDNIEFMVGFTIRPRQRFRAGQRVEFSPMAIRKGISRGRKGGVVTGKVVSVSDGFTIDVLLDGYKRPHGYHHMFFVPSCKRKASPKPKQGSVR